MTRVAPADYVYAAYNAAPPDLVADAAAESRWYGMLRDEPLIGGLELSAKDGLHPRGARHLAGLLDPAWSNVVTGIPVAIAGVAADPGYGLASEDADGRAAAIAAVRATRESVADLADALGATAVRAVELHSAPVARAGASSPDRLADSLAEIAAWDWGSTRLVLEHADALVPAHPPQKGWLDLDGELAATAIVGERTGARIGHGINWGRSAIETGSAAGVEQQLERVRAAGALDILMVSGASGLATDRSAPWEDVHLAISDVEPESLLTRDALTAALAIVADAPLVALGVKVGRAARATTLEERLAPGLATLHALAAAERGRAAA